MPLQAANTLANDCLEPLGNAELSAGNFAEEVRSTLNKVEFGCYASTAVSGMITFTVGTLVVRLDWRCVALVSSQ